MLSKLSLLKKISIILMAGIISVGTACGYYINSFLEDYNYVELTSNDEELGISSEPEEVADLSTEITNIALFGVDGRSLEKIEGNSDSIMVISVDKLHNKIKVISIMRDSLVKVEGYGNRKITEAYGLGGAELAVRTLNENFNLNIREYATVNFEGMAEIIDAVGGVTVNVTEGEMENANGSISEQAFYAGVSPNFITEPGEQVLDGMQAVGYARIRKVDNPNGSYGDFGRTDRQRYIMEQLFNKALAMDITSYPSFVKALLPYMETSLSISQVLDLAGILSREVSFVQTRVPLTEYVINAGYYYNNQSTVYYSLEYAGRLIRSFIYDDLDPETFVAGNEIIWTGIDDSGGTTTASSSQESSSQASGDGSKGTASSNSNNNNTEPSSSAGSQDGAAPENSTAPAASSEAQPYIDPAQATD